MGVQKTLYEILGVRPNTPAAGIRRAYRKLSMKYHPDRNPGDSAAAEMYHAVTHAHTILADPELRRKYDETGATEIPRDMGLSELAGVLVPVFMAIVSECINPKPINMGNGWGMMPPPVRDIKKVDLVSEMTARIKSRRGEVTEQLKEFRRIHTGIGELLGRVTVESGENVFESALREQLAKIAPNLELVAAELKRIESALDYLKSVKYRRDESGRPSGNDALHSLMASAKFIGTSTTSSSGG